MRMKWTVLLIGIAGSGGCNDGGQTNEAMAQEPDRAAQATINPADYSFNLDAHLISPQKVEFTVKTNAPLPMDVTADVGLAGLKDTETWLGSDMKDVTLEKPATTFVVDAVQYNGKPLPKGKYVAEVESNDKSNPLADPKFVARKELILGSTGNASQARDRNAMQRWVLGDMDLNRPWTDAELRSKLGRFQRYDSPNAVNSMVYYFPDADVSLFVDPYRQKVLTAKIGQVP